MLKALGRWAAQRVHGNRRSAGGLLLTRRYYLEDDQEWRLGQCYLGLLGIPYFVLAWIYIGIAYAHRPRVGNHLILGSWSQLGLDAKIIIPIMFVWHPLAILSFVRIFWVWGEISAQPRAEIGE